MPKLIVIIFIIALVGCNTPIKEHVYGTISFEKFHGVNCERYLNHICISHSVELSSSQIIELISIAETKNTESLSIVAIRYNSHRSEYEQSKVIEVVFGKYSTINGKNYDGVEEVSIFKEEQAKLIHLDTVVMLYDPF